jgi:hypothetical protein
MEQLDTTGPDACLEVCGVLVESIKAMKKELRSIYTDKELSLDERWYFFRGIPDELRDNHQWIMHFPEFEKKHGTIEWYDTFVGSKYDNVELLDLVDEQIASYFELEDGETEVDPENLERMKPFTPANLDDFKEAILAGGYHSFTFDW